MQSAPPLVRLTGVSKRFGGVVALDGVDLDLFPGEVHVLLGENGAGKSTLATLLAGMRQPDAGEIVVAGAHRGIASPARAHRLGIASVFQHARMVPTLSLVDNAALGGEWWRLPHRRAIAQRMRAVAQQAGLAVAFDPDVLAGVLSPGERQQAQIVRALMNARRMLVLDEPTAMLAPQDAMRLCALMRRLAARGMAVVFVTHKLDEALAAADRITVLRHGRRVAQVMATDLAAGSREEVERTLVTHIFGAAVPASEVLPACDARAKPLLRVEGLCVADAPVPLHDIALEVRAGEVVGIAGIDGNGQRELAQALAGERTVAQGSILLGGCALRGSGPARRYRLGLRYVTDDRVGEGSVAAFSVALNLLLKRIGDAPFWRGGIVRPRHIGAYARAAVADYDIRPPDVDMPVGGLSGGNLQKVLLARELAEGARVLVLAKPTHGLDMRSAQACHARIRAAAAAGVGVLLLSADLDELLALSHRILVMAGGRIVAAMPNGEGAREKVARAISGRGREIT